MSLDEVFAQVADFHRAFGHPRAAKPGPLDRDRRKVRADWMREEIQEWLEADDIVGQADSMIDLIYFALGSLVELGVRPQELFEIVHRANMAKLWPDGSPRYGESGKVQKPAQWADPEEDLRRAIASQAPGEMDARGRGLTEQPTGPRDLCLAACVARVITAIRPESSLSIDAVANLIAGPRNGRSNATDLDIGIPVEPERIRELVSRVAGRCSVIYVRANTFEEWEFREKVKAAFDAGAQVICTFSAGRLFGHARVDLGHAVVVESLEGERMVRVYDPGPENQGHKDFDCEDMYWAARSREGGIIVIVVEPPLHSRS